MGAPWNPEDPHPGHGFVPKLIVAGRLRGTVDGRPVVIDADESGFVVSFATLSTAWASRRSAPALLPVLAVARRCHVPVRLHVAGLVSLEVLPRPSRIVRMLAPELSALLRE